MNAILEIDDENHVAVVQPGVTLAQLDEAPPRTGSSTRSSPGEYSASLGGNVATNAGGMRAVKYGVTRHHVLGLEAVLATGEVIRTGGKFVKASTGYDLTQLIIGSEGTLALVTEATLKLYPRPAHQATVLAPFPTLDEVTGAVPADRRERHRPADPRVHRHAHDGGDHRARRPRPRHPRRDQGQRARLPRRDDGEHATPTGSTRTSQALGRAARRARRDRRLRPPAAGGRAS